MEFMTTASPSRLTTMSMMPCHRCARTNSYGLFSRSACERGPFGMSLTGSTRRCRLADAAMRRRSVACSEDDGALDVDVVLSESDDIVVSTRLSVAGLCGGRSSRVDSRSWVAKADPRNKLCGMTVAPIIPIAAKTGFSGKSPGAIGFKSYRCKARLA